MELNNELLHAAERGDIKGVKTLLALGADINYTNPKGFTALMLAGDCGALEVMSALLDAGADASQTDLCGLTSLQRAEILGDTPVENLLKGDYLAPARMLQSIGIFGARENPENNLSGQGLTLATFSAL